MSATDLIDAYTAWQRSESRSPRTTSERHDILTRMDAQLPYGLDAATEEELRAWLWQDGWSASTRETYYGAFRDFYRWAHPHYLDHNPAQAISRPKPPQRLPRPVTDDEFTYVLTHAAEPYRLWALLAGYAGLRCHDIANLRRDHIGADRIDVIGSKGGKVRVIPTHPLIWAAVKDLPPGPITDLTARQVSIRSANYLRRLGMPGVSLHRFRHWFGTQVQRRHRDILVTQQLMGHANPATTAGYAMVAAESRRAAIDLLPDLGPGAGGGGSAVPGREAPLRPRFPVEESGGVADGPPGR